MYGRGNISFNTEVPLRQIPPWCQCGALLRPDVVWFGESLPEKDLAHSYTALTSRDCLMVVGTSAVVQSVASFPAIARGGGIFIVEINVESTPICGSVDASILGKSGQLSPPFLERLR